MKFSRFRIALLAFLCGAPLLQADILIMKDGSRKEGTILQEAPDSVRMRYRLTAKIWDEKTFPMSEIQQVVKQTPQEVEVVELRKLKETPDLLKADQYEQIIQDKLRPFVNKYPGTPEAKEVEEIISSLQEEKSKVSNGQIKLEGRWLSVQEAKGEAFNIEGYQFLQAMRERAAKLDWPGAMREFDKFFATRPGHIASTYYPAAISEAILILDKWEAALSKMAGDQPILDKNRKDGLSKLTEPDLSRTKAAIDAEVMKYRTGKEADKRAKIRWSEPYKYDLSSIQGVQKEVMAEKARLQNYDLESMKVQNETLMTVYRKIGEGDYTAGAAAFERASQLQLPQEFREVTPDLKNRLLALYQQLTRGAAGTANTNSGSSAIGGAPATAVDDRVAKLLAQAGGTAAPATGAAATPAPGTAAAPATGAPAAQPAAPAATPAAPAAAPAAQPAAAPAPAPAPATYAAPVAQAPAPAPAPMPPPAEESNMQLYIIIAMGALVLILGVAFLKKK